MKTVKIAEINTLLEKISSLEKLYIPADDGKGQARFLPYQTGMELTEKLNTVRSAKDLFFPQVENLLKFKVAGQSIEIIDDRDEVAPFVVFGVRACDCRSFDILDRVFIDAEPQDTFYANRRANGTIITLACNAPEETCFCTALEIDPANPAGDITAWKNNDAYFFRANTEKGEKLLNALELECGDDSAVEEVKKEITAIAEKLPFGKLDMKAFNSCSLMTNFRDEHWEKLAESCLGCGTCTFVCPTCQCYDIKDFNTGDKIQRFRCWDSCMYSDFTMMAHGNNRNTQAQRFRQRFMHKLVYYPNNNDGIIGCVGCGRCLQKCPVNANIVKVVKTIGGGKV